ncbi:hypothetical protein V1505DRAFT_318287 [Lipomyces doorenjongii]
MFSETTEFSCRDCGDRFDARPALYKHRQNYHPQHTTFKVGSTEYPIVLGQGNGKFNCPKCNSQVSGLNSLRRHVLKCGRVDRHDEDALIATIPGSDDGDHETPNEHVDNIPEIDCLSLEGLGFHVDQRWKVATCRRCRYIVDPQNIINHVQKAHRLNIPNIEQARRGVDAVKLRTHLAVVSHEDEGSHYYMSDDDDDATVWFLPGSRALTGLPVYQGFKCMICLGTCTLTKASMRSHIFRNHRGSEAKHYAPTSVQAFYDRSALQQQLCYVEVSVLDEDENSSHRQQLHIPADIEQVRGHDMVVERRDKNQFGDKFGAYHLIENVINFEELKPWFLKPTMKGFQELKRITIAYLHDCWTHVSAGFQPILAKIMQFDENRQFLHAVQQKQTILNYGEIWAQVLWLGCIAAKEFPPSIATGIVLTPEQRQHATHLLHMIEDLTTDIPEEQSKLVMDLIVRLSIAILRQESEVVNFNGVNC